MYPHLGYCSIFAINLLFFMSSGIAYSENKVAKYHLSAQYNYREKAEALPNKNRQSEIAWLNTQTNAASSQGRFQEALQRLQQALAISKQSEHG